MWAIEHYEVEPDLLVSGKTLGGGLPLAAVTGRAEIMDAVHPGGLGGTFGGNPRRVRRGDRRARRALGPGYASAREQIAAIAAHAARRDRRAEPDRRRGARARRDARARARRADARRREGGDCGRLRERADPPLVRSLRERDPAAAAALGDGRGARSRGSGSWRRRLATQAPARAESVPGPATPAVRLTGIRRTYGDVVAIDEPRPRHRRGRVLHDARPVRLGQDDDAARDRRLRAARRRQRSSSPASTSRAPPPYGARRQHRLPGLRAVPAHDRARERRLRAAREGRRPARAPRRRRTRCSSGCACRSSGGRKPVQLSGGQRQRVALARAIVNQPVGAAARRAARRARPEAAPGDAGVAQGAPARARRSPSSTSRTTRRRR